MGSGKRVLLTGLDARYVDIRDRCWRNGEGIQGWDSKMERHVAVKVMDQRLSVDQKYKSRFIREIKTMALLQHPNIVPIYDYYADDETAWFVMGHVEGETLAKKSKPDRSPVKKRLMTLPPGCFLLWPMPTIRALSIATSSPRTSLSTKMAGHFSWISVLPAMKKARKRG